MKKSFLLAFVFYASVAFGQKTESITLKDKLILTEPQNKKWLDSLNRIPLENQFSFIVDRMVLDTNVVEMKLYPHGGKQPIPMDKFKGVYKPMTIITFGTKKDMMILNDHFNERKRSNLEALERIKSKISITELKMLTDAPATAIYGIKGAGGVIFLRIEDAQSWKLLKSIK